MNISIDFDDTYTRDPLLWNEFARQARKAGHTVYCVTARASEYKDETQEVWDTLGAVIGKDKCIFTGGRSKRLFCQILNIHIHVWIDDMPEAVVSRDSYNLFPDLDE